MRHALAAALAAFALLSLSACGSAVEGNDCDSANFACQDDASALECKDGKWVAFPCKGAKGCTTSGGDVFCDLSANVSGDGCPAAHEGKGQCSTDGKATLECRNGAFQQTNTCTTCSVQQSIVVCQ